MAKKSKSPLLNFNSWFRDRCALGVGDSILRGPGILCSIYLFLVVLGIVLSTILNLYTLFSKNDISKPKLIVYTGLTLTWSVFLFYYMYSACYMCSGFRGFVVALVLGFVVNVIMMELFKEIINEQRRLFK